MKTINIYDNNFSHSEYSSDFQTSKNIKWNRNFDVNSDEVCFVTDNFLFRKLTNKKLIGWILEPRGINPLQYEKIKKENSNFKKILTYDKELIDFDNKFIFYPHSGCWIKPHDFMVYKKSKLISFISSTKNLGAFGHNFRQEIRKNFDNKIDCFGRGHNEIQYKLQGLQDYMFSIVVENSKFDYYFTEKIIDCFVTGTIPIYWGCPSIGNFFDENGILSFNTLEELNFIINNLTSEVYNSKIPSIKKNFDIVKEYILAEDWIYKNTEIFKK